eukprot:SAG31_NODE_1319_length_8817_cov_1.857077_10_plen_197_part_00
MSRWRAEDASCLQPCGHPHLSSAFASIQRLIGRTDVVEDDDVADHCAGVLARVRGHHDINIVLQNALDGRQPGRKLHQHADEPAHNRAQQNIHDRHILRSRPGHRNYQRSEGSWSPGFEVGTSHRIGRQDLGKRSSADLGRGACHSASQRAAHGPRKRLRWSETAEVVPLRPPRLKSSRRVRPCANRVEPPRVPRC